MTPEVSSRHRSKLLLPLPVQLLELLPRPEEARRTVTLGEQLFNPSDLSAVVTEDLEVWINAPSRVRVRAIGLDARHSKGE